MASWEEPEPWETWDGEAHVRETICDPCPSGNISKEEAGDIFFEYLLQLKRSAAPFRAKHACLLAHWATLAGAVGPMA